MVDTRSVEWTVFQTDFGWVGVAASSQGLVRVTLPQPSQGQASVGFEDEFGPPTPEAALSTSLRDLRQRLVAYFRGEAVPFDDPLALSVGTPFQRRVWEALRSVPRGQVISYGELARQAGSPGTARAVGQAMACNPCPVVIPCHRVVGSDGGLTGFGGGLEMKARMLKMERIVC